MDVTKMQLRIRELKDIHKIPTAELARKTGVSKESLENYSNPNSRLKHPSVEIIEALADFYQVSTDYILGREELDLAAYSSKIRELYNESYDRYLRDYKRNWQTEQIVNQSMNVSYTPGYPYNLIDAINAGRDEKDDSFIRVPLSDDQKVYLEEVLDKELTDREAQCVRFYFKDEQTLAEIAAKFDVTNERIRQVIARALRKLRYQARVKLIKFGYEEAINLNPEVAWAKKRRADLIIELKKMTDDCQYLEEVLSKLSEPDAAKTIPLIEMDLSVRSYNCLMRYFWRKDGCPKNRNTDADIFDVKACMMSGDAYDVRNLGKKSMVEILRKLDEFHVLTSADLIKLSEIYPFAYEEAS